MKIDDFNKPDLKDARKRSTTESVVSTYHFEHQLNPIGENKKYLIQTHGCQGNEADSEKIKGLVESQGFTETFVEAEADLIIINTCAIRANAENKVFGEIGRLKHLKTKKPNLIIAIGGCMPQEEVVVEKLLKTYRQVDIIFGTHNLHKLLDYLKIVMEKHQKVVEVMSQEGVLVENVPTVRDNRFKAWVNIMYGCDEFCTYCIVPYTRGKERSRKPEHIIEEVQNLINEGYQEITLLGQNVNSYGLDFISRTYHFSDLLKDLSVMNISRIRFTTSHPKDFSQDLIDILATGHNLMPYIHLPVQSGSNRILKAMNRKYTKEEYLDLIQKIRKAIPNVSLTTDIIVGFPSETEAEFQETLDLVSQSNFEGAYTFVFSKRVGTPAASMEDLTPTDEKMDRLYRLNDLINEGFKKGNARFVGTIQKVLVEGFSKTNHQILSGYTEHNKLVNFDGNTADIGHIIPIKITESKTWSLKGEVLHE